MRPIWNGDRRDRVKWGALVHLARREQIPCIATVLFVRDGTPRVLASSSAGGEVELPAEVWNHFSALENLGQLAESVALEIPLFLAPWSINRAEYWKEVGRWLDNLGPARRIVFLDPDTGLGAALEHVRSDEVGDLWERLRPGDWLAIYQHGHRDALWREQRLEAFRSCCPGGEPELFSANAIAKDVVMLAVERGRPVV